MASDIVVGVKATVHMPRNTMMMVHNASAIVCGTCVEIRKSADDLERVNETRIINYMRKASATREEIVALLDAESWLSAEQCFDLGFCDVVEDEVTIAASIKDFEILSKYKNVPKFIVVEAKEEPKDSKTKQKIKIEMEMAEVRK